MRMLSKNRLKTPIRVCPGDHVRVSSKGTVVADIKVREPDTFNTAFIAALDPGDMGFARGYVGGIAQEEEALSEAGK